MPFSVLGEFSFLISDAGHGTPIGRAASRRRVRTRREQLFLIMWLIRL
jgi:hypothetical protein